MKIAIAQLNYHVGNIEANTAKIAETIMRSKKSGADITLFSELSVCGWPPFDMLYRKEFIDNCTKAVNTIAEHCSSHFAIVGFPERPAGYKENTLFDSVAVLDNKNTTTISKSTLCNNGTIPESRYFTSCNQSSIIIVKNKRIAVAIGSDIEHITDRMKDNDADLIVNITALPFAHNDTSSTDVLKNTARILKTPVIQVNQTGANGGLIFEGACKVINSRGEIVKQMPSFEESLDFITLEEIEHLKPLETTPDTIALIHDALVCGIRDYFTKNGLRKATLGLSGGIDSAVVAALAEKALGHENIKVLMLPSKYSSQHSVTDAVKLAQNLNIEYEIVPIREITDSIEDTLAPLFEGLRQDVTEENIQARTRGLLLMAFANKFGHILLNTSNKSEAAVGYGTLYGDMCGGLAVIADIYKTDVYRLAHYINRNGEIIPQNTITKVPSAELRPDQKDSDSLPEYNILDDILYRHIELNQGADEITAAGHDDAIVAKTIRMVANNEHKRFQAAPAIKVSKVAFGQNRIMPLVAKH